MKKKVALFANGWNTENLENFVTGLEESFEKDGIDLFVFTSYASYSQDEITRRAEQSIHEMPDYSTFDVIIIFGSGMNSNELVEQILKRSKEVGVPVILQGEDADGVSSVTVNNYVGMKELCDHLIEKHDVKDVVFIGGSPDNTDSNLRLQALQDSLQDHGLELEDEKIVYANWERPWIKAYIDKHYSEKKEKLPDAIVCANDSMALFAMISLEAIGVKIPEEIIVTGFDNINDGRLFFPSVSSVDQRYREQGIECAELAGKLLENKGYVEKKVLMCTAVPGESCGCMNCKNEAEVRRMLGHDMLFKNYMDENLRGRELHVEMCITGCDEYEQIPERIQTDLFRTTGEEGDDFHIYVNPQYKDLVYLNATGLEFAGQYYAEVMDVLASKTDGIINYERTMNTKELFLGYRSEGKRKTYVFCPLRIDQSAIGYMVMGHSRNGFADKKYIDFVGRLDKTMEKYQGNIRLALLNDKLSELMQKDALTSVKNRIAYDRFMEKTEKDIAAGELKQAAIIMCDVNNLKIINDNLGHDAGDIYLKNCSRLLCDTFSHSPIFRIGGDEFVVITATEDFPVREQLLAEMRSKMEAMNDAEISPMSKVSIAVGMAEFDSGKDKSIFDAVKRADAFMYMNKAEMKAKLLL